MPNFTIFTKRAFLTTTLTDLKYNLTDSDGDLCTKLLFLFLIKSNMKNDFRMVKEII